MTKPTEQEIIAQVKYAYTLAQALNIQLAWIREYHNPEMKKAISEAKAKNAHFISIINRSLPPNEIAAQEETGYQFLEKIYAEIT